MAKNETICVVGSGLVGALLAILLGEAGFEVDVYEKRKDPRKDKENRGRSIALSMSDRGWKALRQVGVEEKMKINSDPAYGRVVHNDDGTTHLQDYGDGKQAVWTVDRNYLNSTLVEKAEHTKGVKLFFEYTCDGLDEKTGEITFTHCITKEKIRKQYDHVIGVDGIFSAVRKNLSDKGICKFDMSTLEFGYKELGIPANESGNHVIMDHRVHVWPRKKSILIAFPRNDGSFATTIFLPLAGPDSLESLTTPEQLMAFFEREYKEAISLMPNLKEDFFRNPSSTLTQVIGVPWHYKDKVLLMGDACHAVTPFYGMGMNIGFEDCTVFMDILHENNFDFGKAFDLLEKVRKPNTDAMTELSYKNFQSLNESPDTDYQMKWLLERRIWKLMPEKWTPIYALIAFSEIPLKEVPMIQKKQDGILEELIASNPNILELTDEELKGQLPSKSFKVV